MANLYRLATFTASPFIPLWLQIRRLRGKEDASRAHERFGIAGYKRPLGTLVWLHAASVGEANSVLHLIRLLRERFSDIPLLLTTGTVTSAQLMKSRLPQGVMHQYVPIDTPQATERFMRHWRPDIALWVESEFWPNLIDAANRWQCFMGVINARLSERSFRFWQKYPAMITPMLSAFDIMFAQSDEDATRLKTLGAKHISCVGNLKYDAALLPCDEAVLTALKAKIGARPVWLAASTHPGEEALVEKAHALLAQTRPDLLTIIVPRHPKRGEEIYMEIGRRNGVALRSKKHDITPETAFYIADTLGELGLFYRLCETVFMGGSLVRHGGQNPLEPARLSCAILTGPHTDNFSIMYDDMVQAGACIRVRNAEDLAAQAGNAMGNSPMRKKAKQFVEAKSGTAERLLAKFEPILKVRMRK